AQAIMNSNSTYKGIVWDLGGLFIQVFPERLGIQGPVSPNDAQAGPSKQTGLSNEEFELMHHQFECGLVSQEEFDSAFAQALGKEWIGMHRSDERRRLWNSVLGPWQNEAVQRVQTTPTELPKILLSNTNPWHQEAFEASFLQQFAKSLDAFFDRVIYSHHCGMRKPNPPLYLHAIQTWGMEPSDWIMIDDSPINLEGAAQAGLQTYLHPSNTSPVETMRRLGLLS
ncbi:MAG: HAD family hydrolase, partial [Bacteroidota bacterium]